MAVWVLGNGELGHGSLLLIFSFSFPSLEDLCVTVAEVGLKA